MPEAYRSLLFARGDDPDALDAALASDADAVVADLESSVPADRKAVARDVVAARLTGGRKRPAQLVRVNAVTSRELVDDLALVASLRLAAVVLPQATPEAVAALGPEGPPLLAVVESAAGLRAAYEIAAAARVVGVALGANDLAADLGLEASLDGHELLYARSKLVVDAVAAGVASIVDRVYDAAAAEDARRARALGFRGKSTLVPAHAAAINAVFAG